MKRRSPQYIGMGLFAVWLALQAAAMADATNWLQAVRVGEIDDPRINESSGLAFSRRGQNILWTHNDSGDGPNLYAMDTNGHLRGIFAVSGAQAYDWEEMAACTLEGTPCLVVADTGDNDEIREMCTLYWVPEPEVSESGPVVTGTVTALHRLEFVYEDGPRDCEAIAVAEDGRTVYLISKTGKKHLPCQVYEIALPAAPWVGTLVARAVAQLDIPKVVALDFAPDGQRAIVLTYGDAFEYTRHPGQSWREVFFSSPQTLAMPWRSQGEAICYGPDSLTLYLTSENLPAPLWRIDRKAPRQEEAPPTAPAAEPAPAP
jgi:hypothetical protein